MTDPEVKALLCEGVCWSDDKAVIGKALNLAGFHDDVEVEQVKRVLFKILDDNERDRDYERAISNLGDDA